MKALSILWNYIKYNNIHIIGSQEEKRVKGVKMYLMKLWLQTSQAWKSNWVFRYRKLRISNKMIPNTAIPGISKWQKLRREFWSNQEEKKKKRVHIEGNPNKAMSCFFLQKLCRPEENDMIWLKCWEGKTCNIEYSTEQNWKR